MYRRSQQLRESSRKSARATVSPPLCDLTTQRCQSHDWPYQRTCGDDSCAAEPSHRAPPPSVAADHPMPPTAVVGHFRWRNRRGIATTVSLEVTTTSNAVFPRTHTSRGVSPGAQTARPDPDLAIVGDISTFSALARIIVDECSRRSRSQPTRTSCRTAPSCSAWAAFSEARSATRARPYLPAGPYLAMT